MKPSLGMSHTESRNREFALRRSPRLLGKFGLRRSPRLHGNSAMSMPKRSQIAPRKRHAKGKSAIAPGNSPAKAKSAISTRKSPTKGKSAMTMPESPRKSPAKDSDGIDHELTFSSSPDSPAIETKFVSIATVMRSHREHEAQHFKEMYTYLEDFKEKRTCIRPGGVFDWEDKSSGITWVAVRGRNTTCVVFKRNLEHIKDRLRSYLVYNKPGITFNSIGVTLISEIEVLADLPCKSDKTSIRGVPVDVPFAIVSVDPSNPDDHVDKEAAVKYLKGILKKGAYFHCSATQEIAIHAFQLLCNQKLEPDDIWVASACFGEEVSLRSNEIKRHLTLISRKTDEYKDHVGGSCSAPSI